MLPLILLGYGIYYLYNKYQKPSSKMGTGPPPSEYPQLPPSQPTEAQPPAAQPQGTPQTQKLKVSAQTPAQPQTKKSAPVAPKEPNQPVVQQPPIDPRPEQLTYAPIFDSIHQVLTKPNPLILGTSVKEMQEAGLPEVTGYKRCPTQVKSVGPWVSIYRGRTETIKGTKDLNDLANACDAKEDCLGFNSFLDDGYLHIARDKKSEFLNRATERWVPVYIKDSKFKGCAPGTKFYD